MGQPLISVLMPAFNVEKYIQTAIESQIHQSYSNWELLLCDDCSTDSTYNIAEEYSRKDSRIKVSRNSVNKGYLHTWNELAENVQGEFITFLDADDYADPARLSTMLQFLEENPDISIVGSAINLVSDSGSEKNVKSYPLEHKDILKALLTEKFPFCGSSVMIRKNVLKEAGVYRPFFDRLGWEDHDWLIRVCRQFRAANVPQALYNYRNNAQSVTRNFSIDRIEKIFIRKIGIDIHKTMEETGVDLLDGAHFWELHRLVIKYTLSFQSNRNLFYRYLLIHNTSQKLRFRLLIKALKINPFDIRTLYCYLFK